MADPTDVPTATSNALAPDPEQVVRAFLAALEALDVDAAVALLDPDVTYHNKGLPAAHGITKVEKQLRGFGRFATGFQAITHNLAVDGDVVLTERTDVIEIGRFQPAFWVCGTFEVRDGRIVLWRDYFDFADVTVAMVKAVVRMARRR